MERNKLTEAEKKEMLEDGRSLKRRTDFRMAREVATRRSFEEYLHWLTETTSAFPEPARREFVVYRNTLL